ncbi:MAG: hypothetical protein LBT33_08210 [Spirochaetia bacterium]|jgi:hypothetical protein|nr:hypothetical protein [Spirochaetia bacterium]
MDIFFEFANTFTEESVREWKMKTRREEGPDAGQLRSVGYSDRDILEMFQSTRP